MAEFDFKTSRRGFLKLCGAAATVVVMPNIVMAAADTLAANVPKTLSYPVLFLKRSSWWVPFMSVQEFVQQTRNIPMHKGLPFSDKMIVIQSPETLEASGVVLEHVEFSEAMERPLEMRIVADEIEVTELVRLSHISYMAGSGPFLKCRIEMELLGDG